MFTFIVFSQLPGRSQNEAYQIQPVADLLTVPKGEQATPFLTSWPIANDATLRLKRKEVAALNAKCFLLLLLDPEVISK